ncbi:hypothetical protein RhiirC2_794602 [Rhizophagus irregularis]|uniref:Uncharacterized protein n=1 Tax=Rhizophagus irregularis TaxID=588596 RepID=A0A2N1MD82_9GLOM|nr:hypothetical protein RhiirC2_794602 [Rhizophagus irregularis]
MNHTEAFFSEQSSEQTDDEQTKFVLRILNGRVWKSKFMSKTNKNSDELSKENNKIIECDDVDKHLNVHSFNLYMDAVPTLFQKAITNDLHRVQKSTVSTENLIKWDMNINHIEINLAVFKKHNTEWNLVISRRIDNHHYKYKYSAITKINYIPTTPTITFVIPYINFVNYSNDYNWLLELIRPQPSSFTETINRNIYKTWNGEALINFKWNNYGKYYYAIIWILFMTLLGCFTAAAMTPQQYINEEVRQQLFITSIILGFIHLIFEICQFFYNIIKWYYNFWNIFGKYV